jgi:hypothetical protein
LDEGNDSSSEVSYDGADFDSEYSIEATKSEECSHAHSSGNEFTSDDSIHEVGKRHEATEPVISMCVFENNGNHCGVPSGGSFHQSAIVTASSGIVSTPFKKENTTPGPLGTNKLPAYIARSTARLESSAEEGYMMLCAAVDVFSPHNEASGTTEVVTTGVEATDNFGDTALHLAAGSGMLLAVRALLGTGADANALNTWGLTPLALSAAGGHTGCMALLQEYGGIHGDFSGIDRVQHSSHI